MIFTIALVIIMPVAVLALLFFAPPGQSLRHKLKERINNWRSQCWTYSVETASEFLASILTHPNVEPLVVNVITMAIDKWVDKNSDEVKGSAMAMGSRVKDNIMITVPQTVPGRVGGKLRDTAVKISGGRISMTGGDEGTNKGESEKKQV